MTTLHNTIAVIQCNIAPAQCYFTLHSTIQTITMTTVSQKSYLALLRFNATLHHRNITKRYIAPIILIIPMTTALQRNTSHALLCFNATLHQLNITKHCVYLYPTKYTHIIPLFDISQHWMKWFLQKPNKIVFANLKGIVIYTKVNWFFVKSKFGTI